MLNTSDEKLRADLHRRLVAQSLLGHLATCFSILFSLGVSKGQHGDLFSVSTVFEGCNDPFKNYLSGKKDRLSRSKTTLILQCCLSENFLMAMWPTCSYFSLHGAKQKVKKFLAEAPFTRYTGMAGRGACDFTKKAPTVCARHAWSSDQGFTQRRLLSCQH